MIITYLGHSSFKLKGKRGTVATDPFDSYVGFDMPTTSADIVTVSHAHRDHNATDGVSGTSRREQPFLVTEPGEYEVGGISVFGVPSFHDASEGVERGKNTIFTIFLDDLRICHLGDLGHALTQEYVEQIGTVDVLLCPVGGIFTIDPEQAAKVVRSLEPSVVIPMHFKTDQHDQKVFGELQPVEAFFKALSVEVTPEPKLDIEKATLPEELEVHYLLPQA